MRNIAVAAVVLVLGACSQASAPRATEHHVQHITIHVSANPDNDGVSENQDDVRIDARVPVSGHHGEIVARLTVARLGVHNFPVRKGVTLDVLANGPGVYHGSPAPGTGNFALAGHDVTPVGPWSHGPFRYLDRLHRGDIARVVYHGHTYRYVFVREFQVRPDHTNMLRSQEFDMTMTSCYPPGSAAFRLIAQWRLT